MERLSDTLDIAAARAEEEIKNILAQHKAFVEPEPNGECFYCGAAVDGLYCDDECRAEHVIEKERHARLRKITGK